MKPTYVLLNGGPTPVAINTQDIKSIVIDNGVVTITTSSDAHVMCDVSQHMLDRITQELRSRYNIVTLNHSGFNVTNNRKDNSILDLRDASGKRAVVFPKGLQALSVVGARVTVLTFGVPPMVVDVTGSCNHEAAQSYLGVVVI